MDSFTGHDFVHALGITGQSREFINIAMKNSRDEVSGMITATVLLCDLVLILLEIKLHAL